MMIVGYARVSTNGQTLATQKALVKKAGVDRIHAEKVARSPSGPRSSAWLDETRSRRHLGRLQA
jgi:DNA invertase Pin-like site-specific DNA recombinase